MKQLLFKLRQFLALLFLLLCVTGVQAQTDNIYIDSVYAITAGSNTQWYANVELGPNAQLYIEDGEKAYFYGDSFKIAPTAKIYGVNNTWTSFTQGSGTGSIVFRKANPMTNGTASQYLNGGNVTIPGIEIDNITDLVLINTGIRIGTNLTFTKGHLWCGTNNTVLASTATITGADQAKYVVTNSTGFLAKEGLSNVAFTFPVGYTADPLFAATPTGYLPVRLTNTGTADRYDVRAINTLFPSPANPAQFLKVSWQIKETVPGGSNVTLALQHNTAANQGSSYLDATAGNVASPAAVNWQAASAAVSTTATGSIAGSSLKTLAGITDFTMNTYFTKGGAAGIYVDVKVYLQGAWNGRGMMTNTLRTMNLVPASQPYNTAPFNYTGIKTTSLPTNVTDWVLVELRSSANPATVMGTQAGLLLQNGHVVDVDGVSPLRYDLPAGNYYVAVRHRNHLGIRTPATLMFTTTNSSPATPAVYDFTTAQSQAYQNPVIMTNAAQAAVSGGAFAMWGANGANTGAGATTVRATGAPAVNDLGAIVNALSGALVLSNVYSLADYNMNGSVRSSGAPAVNDFTFLVSVLGINISITQHQ